MFTRLIRVAAICAALTGTTCQASVCLDWCLEVEPYIGITGGVAPIASDYSAFATVGNDTHSAIVGTTNGLVGGVVGCQTHFWNCIFAAIQGNALYNTMDNNLRTDTNASGFTNHGVSLKNDFQWGVDLRLGLEFCHANPYFLAGFESGKWSLGLQNFTGTSFRGIPANSNLSFSDTLWAPKIGGGVVFPLCQCINLNMEYSYAWFGNIKALLRDSVTGLTWRHKVNVRQNAFQVGLNYIF